MRLLLIEDDRMIGESLRAALRLEGYAADWVRDLSAARSALSTERFDLVLLDLGLPAGGPGGGFAGGPAGSSGHGSAGPASTPGLEGLTLLREIRARGELTPVIVLTARDHRGDRVAGLDAGADDYLVKPFDLDELNARIRAVLRRQGGRAQPALRCGPVSLDPATRQVFLNEQPVMLSAREFAVLEALMMRPGALLSRAQLEDRLYGWGEEIESNAVSVYIHQLRRKLGAQFIRTVRGVGYLVSGQPGEGEPQAGPGPTSR